MVDFDEETGCVGAEDTLVVWPPGTEFAPGQKAVKLPDGELVFDGTRLGVSGGDHGLPEVLERCRRPGLEQAHWFVFYGPVSS